MSMPAADAQRALSRFVRLETPLLQSMELAAPWCIGVDGCAHPGMYVVHRGAVRVDVFGERVDLAPQDVLLLPQGGGQHVVGDTLGTKATSLDAFAAREDGRDGHFVRFRGPGSRSLLSGIPFASAPLAWLPRVIVGRRRDRDPVARSLFEAYERALEHAEADVVARVAEALWLRTIAEQVPSAHRIDGDVLRAANAVLDAPAARHTLGSLARAACLSRSRFSARFAAAFGEAPMRWVARVRMDHADKLLREGAMSVAAVADALGFNDESAFRKAYRRVRGTPARRTESLTRSPARAPRTAAIDCRPCPRCPASRRAR